MKNIKIFENPDILANTFAREFVKLSESKPFFNTCLSGGSTPKLLFEKLGTLQEMPKWENQSFFWGDERCVPPTDSESNYLMAKKTLFDQISIPHENIHRIKGENYAKLEVVRYGAELLTCLPQSKAIPMFDLLLLGMGDDGHTASIFPNNIELFNSTNILEISQHPLSQQRRITITGKIIEHAHKIVFLVTGKNKAEKIKEIYKQTGNFKNYPAWLVQKMRPDAEWWLDSEAASSI